MLVSFDPGTFFICGVNEMKKLVCLMLGILLLGIAAGGAIAVESEPDVTEPDGTPAETVPEALPQNVQNQLDIAIMALGLADTANTDPTVPPDDTAVVEEEEEEEEETVDPEKMEELAERHAFIAWAHYNHVPASRKLQEEVFGQIVEDPDAETTTTPTTVWDGLKETLSTLTPEEYQDFLTGIEVPEGLVNENGKANWGQYKKAAEMSPLKAQTSLKAARGKALGTDKEKEEHGNKGGNNSDKGGNGGGNGNAGGNGNGGGNGKNK